MKGFNRKIFTPALFWRELVSMLFSVAKIRAAMHNARLSRAFVEKIMLVVTAINGCPYCAWFHARSAVSSGVSDQELKDILDLQFGTSADPFEVTALLYAQHCAETNRQPDPEMDRQLMDFYGEETAGHIRQVIQMIFFGNLAGNTFDAFISRLKGHKAPNSNVLFEAVFFVLSAPILLPLMPVIRGAQPTAS